MWFYNIMTWALVMLEKLSQVDTLVCFVCFYFGWRFSKSLLGCRHQRWQKLIKHFWRLWKDKQRSDIPQGFRCHLTAPFGQKGTTIVLILLSTLLFNPETSKWQKHFISKWLRSFGRLRRGYKVLFISCLQFLMPHGFLTHILFFMFPRLSP